MLRRRGGRAGRASSRPPGHQLGGRPWPGEPSRFAFQDARILFTRDPALAPLLEEIPHYPVAEKAERIARFHAQLETGPVLWPVRFMHDSELDWVHGGTAIEHI